MNYSARRAMNSIRDWSVTSNSSLLVRAVFCDFQSTLLQVLTLYMAHATKEFIHMMTNIVQT